MNGCVGVCAITVSSTKCIFMRCSLAALSLTQYLAFCPKVLNVITRV